MLSSAKVRRIREGIAELLNKADRDFLKRQSDKGAFAKSLAWELSNSGYCTQGEYESEVLPYLLEQKEYLDRLRRKALTVDRVESDDLPIFSELVKQIGREIRQARREKGWSQLELAEEAGTFQPVVSRVEAGDSLKQPTLELLDRFARALGKQLVVELADAEPDRVKAITSPKRGKRKKVRNA